MRILKSFAVADGKTALASRMFDKILARSDYPWRFGRMELHIRDENRLILKEGTCLILLDYNDIFVQQSDARGIAAMILRMLFKAIARTRHGSMPEPLEDVIANREMIRKGHGDELVYYYYARQEKGGLAEDIAWLSFWPQDKYNYEFFRDKSKTDESRRELAESLKRDLEVQDNFEKAVIACRKIEP